MKTIMTAAALSVLTVSSFGVAASSAFGQIAQENEEAKVIALINRYAKSIESADVELASKVWLTNESVSFIQPRGHQHGWKEVKTNFYEKTMGANFTKRSLKVRKVAVHVMGDAAWAEFYWEFNAVMRKDESKIRTEGRETQVLTKTDSGWRIVHVHYSAMPVTGDREGF